MIFWFYGIAAVVAGGAGVVCFSRSVVGAVMGLMMVMAGVMGFYVMLHAEFVAVAQGAVLLGGMSMMMMAGAVLTRKGGKVRGTKVGERVGVGVVAGVMGVGLVVLCLTAPWRVNGEGPGGGGGVTADSLGGALVAARGWLVPVVLMGVVLLVVMIGGAYLARTRRRREVEERAEEKAIQTAPDMEHFG